MTNRARCGALATLVVVNSSCHLLLDLDAYQLAESDGAGVCRVDNVRDGRETDVDCGGGACPPCLDQKGCVVGADCVSGVCIGGACATPSCTDGVKNGDEVDTDCGASCPKCGPGKVCTQNLDCRSDACAGGFCESTCSDGVQGGDESDIDCGGSTCPKCPDDNACSVGSDCESGVCKKNTCVAYHIWSKGLGGSGSLDSVGVAVDGSGNAALTFTLSGIADLGGGPLTSAGLDVGVAKFDGSGKHLWSKVFGDSALQIPADIATDTSGNIVLTGQLFGTANFGGGPLISAAGSSDIFVAKFASNATGAHWWSKRFGDTDFQTGTAITTDKADNVIVTGNFLGQVNLGGGSLTCIGDQDLFVAKFDPAGTHLWSKQFGDSQMQVVTDVTTNDAGDVFLVGLFGGTISFGGSTLNSANGNGMDMFVAKLDPSGAHVWSKRFGGVGGGQSPYEIAPSGIKVDNTGSVLIAGSFNETITWGSDTIKSAGGEDIFIAKLDPSGTPLWSKRFGSAQYDMAADIDIDGMGNPILTGQFTGSISFGGGSLTGPGGGDVFVAKLDTSGAHLWSKGFGDIDGQVGKGIAANGQDQILVTGNFNGSIDLGGGILLGKGMEDVFLAKIRTP